MIICLCMCQSHMEHSKILNSKPSTLRIDPRDIVLPLTYKYEYAIYFWDKIYHENLGQLWHSSYRRSSQCVTRIIMNDHNHVEFIDTSNYIPLRSEPVHIVIILKISHCTSWKSRRSNWIRQSEEVVLY